MIRRIDLIFSLFQVFRSALLSLTLKSLTQLSRPLVYCICANNHPFFVPLVFCPCSQAILDSRFKVSPLFWTHNFSWCLLLESYVSSFLVHFLFCHQCSVHRSLAYVKTWIFAALVRFCSCSFRVLVRWKWRWREVEREVHWSGNFVNSSVVYRPAWCTPW